MSDDAGSKKNKKLSKDVLNIIRTTMRNNIDLTHIADNKANVLLSLSALMMTFLLPFLVPYIDVVKHYMLWIPLLILVITCLITIYITTLVLKPGKFYENLKNLEKGRRISPFFFGNFYKMSPDEYRNYIDTEIEEGRSVRTHVTADFYYVGARLGRKMELMRVAFNIFMIGFFTAIILSGLLFIIRPDMV